MIHWPSLFITIGIVAAIALSLYLIIITEGLFIIGILALVVSYAIYDTVKSFFD